MSQITKSDIAASVAEKLGTTKGNAETVVNAAVSEIRDALQRGNDVRLAGLGTFQVKDTAARTGRNPATGETIEISAGKKIAFKAEKGLKAGL